jgi:hypothetical protein
LSSTAVQAPEVTHWRNAVVAYAASGLAFAPAKAAARVSVVSTIGYGAFLCGPPLLGLLAEHVGILHSLLAVMAVLVVSFLLSPVARKSA